MIVRVLSATLKAERAGTFHDLMRTQLPILRGYPGLRYVKLCRRIYGGEEEVLLVEEWKDAASLYDWAGPDLDKPRLLPGAEELVIDLHVAHYEALDMDPYPDDPLFDRTDQTVPGITANELG
jgi:heme-degrading monooxygenase HmoA